MAFRYIKYFIILKLLFIGCIPISVIKVESNNKKCLKIKEGKLELYGYNSPGAIRNVVIKYDFKDTVIFNRDVEVLFRGKKINTVFNMDTLKSNKIIGEGEIFFGFYIPNYMKSRDDTMFYFKNDISFRTDSVHIPKYFQNIKDTFYIPVNSFLKSKKNKRCDTLKYYTDTIIEGVHLKKNVFISSGGYLKYKHKNNKNFHEVLK